MVDPEVITAPATGQVDDLVDRLRAVVEKNERALVTTLTKRSSEDLSEYLEGLGFAVRYIHSELDAFERAELLRDIRRGDISVLVGVNLLREGIDLPEVSLVAIIDADREGFLRSRRSLIQMTGRAARNAAGVVVLYADTITGSIRAAMEETNRRRVLQTAYNKKHGISPKTIVKKIVSLLPEEIAGVDKVSGKVNSIPETMSLQGLEEMMWRSVEKLEFEKAASLRDLIQKRSGGATPRAAMDRGKRRKRT